MPTRGCYNGTLLANECKQTRSDGRGCDNEGVQAVSWNAKGSEQIRPDCRGVLQGVCQRSGFVNVVAGDAGAAAGVVGTLI